MDLDFSLEDFYSGPRPGTPLLMGRGRGDRSLVLFSNTALESGDWVPEMTQISWQRVPEFCNGTQAIGGAVVEGPAG
jgi:hypothetical protein